MNKAAEKPLIIKISGGKNGGGTAITEYGLRMISAFDKLTENCREFMDDEIQKLGI
jgi:molybdate transport system regulatory protein